MALSYFKEAIDIQWSVIDGYANMQTRDHLMAQTTVVDFNEPSRREQFILGCRYFNKGIAKLMLIKQQQIEQDFEEKPGRKDEDNDLINHRKVNPLEKLLLRN